MAERRMFSRVVYLTPATIRQGESSWTSNVLDLSLKGALLSTPEDWGIGNETDYVVSFKLHDSDIELSMELQLIQDGGDYLRFQIDHIDIDSASHLKRLVELNVGNDDLLHRELAQLTDLKDTV
ncbi:pilus assembly protein [Enterovibrio norvegicus FF-33]|uniref:Cyclic diguanosine monophosphate-binding protein n=1 Tax=Enterovibrio norvegicus FF-454 TaxID=1185651 RepID=A0A1E5C386_9GAMM|nr:PilZ domain-containing protein [Enterovibrio norvegicus]OEE59941.1 pilus assembly protein [Enterovibrio norvegicus FF-454]OEE69783.1 pilus assembly protein [Enterovibrio norvegicus FF-33]OEE74129.1 pilus assembly protein [Enterovibrio norvegicus FF-162]